MLKQIARTLHEAMSGWGTDEEAIYGAFAGRTQEQVGAIARVYQQMYNADLLQELKSELNDSEMEHLAMFSPTAAPGEPGTVKRATALADMIAEQLNKAMRGVGTDEEAIYAALTGRTTDELRAIQDAYARLTNRDLAADIEDEMSGTELTRAKALLSQGMLMPEDEIYLAVKGLGTDEETLFRVLKTVKGDRAKIIDLIDRYAAKGYGDLLADVRDDLSNIFGDDLIRSMENLHGATPTTSCSTDQRNTGLEALSVSVSMTQNAVSKADADITAGALSGNVETALQDNFNPGGAANAVDVALLTRVRDRLSLVRTNILTLSDVTCVASDPRYCVEKPDCSRFIYGWASINLPASTVRLCNAFFDCLKNEDDRGRGLVHECAHRTGIEDKFYKHDAGFSTLTPQGNKSATDSLDNADSYAYFAKQLD
ncbi:MAG: M35 family metallo-endopeptidase [Pirellulaceae bacterium]